MRKKILLDPAWMQRNSGLCALAKMMLISMWRKFGQKPNEAQVRDFDDLLKFRSFHESEKYDIRHISVLTEQRMEIHFNTRSKTIPFCSTLISLLSVSQRGVQKFSQSSQSSFGQLSQRLQRQTHEGDFMVEFALGAKKLWVPSKEGKARM